MTPRIVAYATQSYADEAKALRATAEELCLDIQIRSLTGEWSWHEAVSFKPRFLQEQLLLLPDNLDGIFYVDADARFRKVPDFSILDGYDFAYHSFRRGKLHRRECLTGTLWLANKPVVRAFLNEWIDATRHETQSSTPEQDSLAQLLSHGWDKQLRILDLPPEFVWIHNDSFHVYGDRRPVIEHMQASRRKRYAK